MWNSELQAVILAAGKAKRFKTGRTKLLEKICGREMILYPTFMLEKLDIETAIVVGHQKEEVQEKVIARHGNAIKFVHQGEQLGTGHALLCTRKLWNRDNILVLNGDMPLVAPQIIQQLYEAHQKQEAVLSFVISHLEHPGHAYGRVVEKDGHVAIVEAKEFKGEAHKHCWINAGIYLINKKFLKDNIDQLQKSDVSQEFYLTDLVGMASKQKKTVATVPAPFDLVRGINNLEELWAAEQVQRAYLIRNWMRQGVRFMKAQNVHLDIDVTIGAGSCIGGGVYLLAGTTIGTNCSIQEYTRLENATIEPDVTIRSHSVVVDSTVCENSSVGPFAHLRKGTVIERNGSIGNFVEVKNCTIGKASRARHLAYLGDATVGKNVNVGAGTITCNYDGVTKNKTTIGNDSFIGSNSTLVAPITIGNNCFTAAGSTITKDVPTDALAFGRAQQVNKEDYVPKLMAKIKKQASGQKKEHNEYTQQKKQEKEREL